MKTFDLTSKSVREFADRVVMAHPELDKPKALEIASHGFGYRNFDTLSGVLKGSNAKPQQAPAQFKLEKPVTLWIEGFVCDNDVAVFDWLKVTLTSTFIENLLARRTLCSSNGLLHVSEDASPADWSQDEDVGVIRDWQLYVSPTRFWFRGHPKHASYSVESRAVYLDDLLGLLKTPSAEDESFLWIDGALYKDACSAEGLRDVIEDLGGEDEWVEPESREEAEMRALGLSVQIDDNLDKATHRDILAEIAYLEDWLKKNP